MANPLPTNLTDDILDEIALEGLDGITITALWLRLQHRPNFTLSSDDYGKNFIWKLILKNSNVEFFKLPVPREPLIIFNRYDFVDPDIGIVLEPADKPEDIYPHNLIDDKVNKIKGSCQHYETRENITAVIRKDMPNLKESEERWGNSLVIVASQSVRQFALMGSFMDPITEVSPVRYCILERIGRSRYLGEITQGKASLQDIGEPPKSLFYHRKFLSKCNLVTKQVHHQKTGNQNCSGSLLHLPRFFVERLSKTLILTHRVVAILRSKPNCVADYEEIRKELGMSNMLKKLFKTPDFRRFIRVDLKLPYRALYPEAKTREWKRKANDMEKTIRAIQLINPDMDDNDIFVRDDDNDDADAVIDLEAPKVDLLHDRSILHQAFYALDSVGADGVSQNELCKIMGVSKLQARTICRNLLRLGLVSTYMNDIGRQRVARFVSKRYVKDSTLAIQFNKEKEKMYSLIANNKSKMGNDVEPIISEVQNNKTKVEGQTKRSSKTSLASDQIKKIKTKDSIAKNSISLDTSANESASEDPNIKTEESSSTKEPQASTSKQNLIETKIFEVSDGDFGIQINENVSGFVEEMDKSYPRNTKDGPCVTYRLLKRANLIIEAVQKYVVIDDLTKLIRMINEVEELEGYLGKIDKKSLLRLLLKLNKDNNIKFLRVQLKSEKKEKCLNFVCIPGISYDHSIIQSAIEQEKMKFFILTRDNMPKPEEPNPEICTNEETTLFNDQIVKSTKELKAMSTTLKEKTFIYDRNAGKKYGFCPKFIRMRTLHQFLFYLIYGYQGDESLDKAAAIAELQDGAHLSKADVAELPNIYMKELCWKTFIPPLPIHPGWPSGWAIICDILLRIPLSIFVKVFNVTYVVPHLMEYLAHPTRRYFLLKNLPPAMRNNLMVARKYIYNFHEILQRLCFIGVAQFGPQRLKEKDQVFVFLNRRSSLLNTTPSKPAYHQISESSEYVKHSYTFNNLNDVDKYWYEMWNICLHTRLGGRLCMTGQEIIFVNLLNKLEMIEALRVRSPDEAPKNDTGFVPGDKRGAAGLDSALFSHLKRNWNWTSQHCKSEVPFTDKGTANIIENLRKSRLANLKVAPVKFDKILSNSSTSAETRESMSTIIRKRSVYKKPIVSMSQLQTFKPRKLVTVTRTFKPTKAKTALRPWYDDIDHRAEGLMTRRRVKWSEEEDNFLLLCKVASIYMCPNPRKQHITFQSIRDICHSIMPSTRTKTSRACQRRILVMMKNKTTVKNVSLHLEEVKQDEFINKNFGNVVSACRRIAVNPEELERMVGEQFKLLVPILKKKFNRTTLTSSAEAFVEGKENFESIIPDKHQEIIDSYEVLRPPDTMKKKGKFQEPRNTTDINCATVSTIVHSTLCCVPDKTSFMYQLFKIYQQYPDNLLRSVMAKLRADQMVSLRKSYIQKLHKTGNYLPVSSLPYQLSISYFYLLQTKYDFEVYDNCHQMRKKLLAHYKEEQVADLDELANKDSGMECIDLDGGSAACIVELFCSDSLTLNLHIPENIVILDPRMSETDEAYVKILARYQEIVRSCKLTRTISPNSKIFTKPTFISSSDKLDGDDGDVPSDLPVANMSSRITACKFNVKTLKKYTKQGEESSDSEDFSDEEEEKEDKEQTEISAPLSRSAQYTIARAASRIALFSMREDFLFSKPGVLGETQHAHDFLVVNSCKVHCELRKSQSNNVSKFLFHGDEFKSGSFTDGETFPSKATFTPLTSDTSNDGAGVAHLEELTAAMKENCKQVLETIKSVLVVPEGLVARDEAKDVFMNAGASPEDWEQACHIIKYIESKRELGATTKELRGVFSNMSCDKTLAEILQQLTKTWFITRVGLTTYHYVYQKYLKPWLLHSYKIKRLAREKLPQPINLAELYNIGREQRKRTGSAEERRTITKRKRDMEMDYGTIEEVSDSKRVKADKLETTINDVCMSHSKVKSEERSVVLNEDEKKFKISTNSSSTNEVDEQNKIIIVTDSDGNPKQSGGECSSDLSITNSELKGDQTRDEDSMEVDKSLTESTEVDYQSDVGSKNDGNNLNDSTENTEKDEGEESKLLDTPLGDFNLDAVVCNVDDIDTEAVHVMVRPWVRVDGSFNRRVIDRMLGSVLSFCMSQPGTSILKIQDRFSPALQPIHTREVLEILEKIGCLKLQVVKKSWKPSLFSKPFPVIISDAEGSEDESSLFVKIAIDAITRLSIFIGDKAYKFDFLNSQL